MTVSKDFHIDEILGTQTERILDRYFKDKTHISWNISFWLLLESLISLLVCSPLDRDWLRPLRLLTPPALCNHDPYSLAIFGYFRLFSNRPSYRPGYFRPTCLSCNLSYFHNAFVSFQTALKMVTCCKQFHIFFTFRTARTCGVTNLYKLHLCWIHRCTFTSASS